MKTKNLYNKDQLQSESIDEGELGQLLRHPIGCCCGLCVRWQKIVDQVRSVLR